MSQFDTVIKGGTVVDGTLMPPFKADVGIKDGKITKIGKINTSEGAKVLDASGMIVAPGAVDLHAHYDAPILVNGEVSFEDGQSTGALPGKLIRCNQL